MKIGILYICTGNYHNFFEDFYNSSKEYFLKEHQLHFFVFASDNQEKYNKPDITFIPQHQYKWPHAVLLKFHYFLEARHLFEHMDYLYMFNSNMTFVAPVGEEVLPSENEGYLVGVEHPGNYKTGSYQIMDQAFEKNPQSTAFISQEKMVTYLAAGFTGGRTPEFMEMAWQIRNNIELDYAQDIIALWHDETHINKYLLSRKAKIVEPSYCYPEEYEIPYPKKIVVEYKGKKGVSFFRKLNIEQKRTYKSKSEKYKAYFAYYAIKFLKKYE